MDEIKPKRVKWGVISGGVLLALPIAAGVGADILNNVTFAIKTMGFAGAFVAGGFGVLVGALPVMMALNGSNWRLRQAHYAVICVTIVFAVLAYGDKQAEYQSVKDAAGQSLGDAASARNEARKARETAMAISEPLSVSALATLEETAKKTFESAERAAKAQGIECVQSRRCREAQVALNKASERKGQAETKASLLADAKAADARAEAKGDKAGEMGTSKANASAAMFAKWIGADARDAEANAAFLLLIMVIAATMSTAIVGEDATNLIVSAFKVDPEPKAKKSAPVMKEVATQPALEKRKDIAAYIVGCTVAIEQDEEGNYIGKPVLGSKLYDDFKSWWAMQNPGKKVPSSTPFGTAMGKAYGKTKTKGQQHYYAKITDWRPAKPNLEKVA